MQAFFSTRDSVKRKIRDIPWNTWRRGDYQIRIVSILIFRLISVIQTRKASERRKIDMIIPMLKLVGSVNMKERSLTDRYRVQLVEGNVLQLCHFYEEQRNRKA